MFAQMEEYQLQVEELATFMASHTKYIEDEIAEKLLMNGTSEEKGPLPKAFVGRLLVILMIYKPF